MGNSNNVSTKIYFGLITVLAVLSAFSVYLPQGNLMPAQDLPASKPVLALINALIMFVIYGGLGYAGLRLSRKIGFAEVWDLEISSKKRFLLPALTGAGIGVIIIIIDIIFSKINSFGPLPHPVFPTSLVASVTAGIGEEIIFRLFFISFWVWLVSSVILKERWKNEVFWIVTGVSAIIFSLAHFPSFMYLTGVEAISDIPELLMIELFLMNGIVSVFAAWYLKKYGFLAAAGIHFWADVVWHVLWGII